MTSTWIRLHDVAVHLLLSLYQHLVSSTSHGQQFNNQWYNTIWKSSIQSNCELSVSSLQINIPIHIAGFCDNASPAVETARTSSSSSISSSNSKTDESNMSMTSSNSSGHVYATATAPERKVTRTEKEKQLGKIKRTCYKKQNKWPSSKFLISVLRLTPSRWKRLESSQR